MEKRRGWSGKKHPGKNDSRSGFDHFVALYIYTVAIRQPIANIPR
jgi:hypothetical protein